MQYLGVRFDPEEFRRDLLSLVNERRCEYGARSSAWCRAGAGSRAEPSCWRHSSQLRRCWSWSGLVGLQGLSGVNERTEELIKLQRKIEAYRQVQHDTTSQLYSVASALLSSDERTLTARCASSTSSATTWTGWSSSPRTRSSCSSQFRHEYDRFVEIVTQVVELIRAGQHGRGPGDCRLQQAHPLADRLERLTNQLVNKAEADMVAGIEASTQAYATRSGS